MNLNAVASEYDRAFFVAVLLAQVPLFASLFMTTYRHILFIGEPSVKFSVGFNAIILSTGLNNIVPGRIAELIKVTYIRDHADKSYSSCLSAVILERLADLIILAILTITGAFFLSIESNIYLPVLLTIGSFLLISSIIYFEKELFLFLKKFVRWKKLRHLLQDLLIRVKRDVLSSKFICGLFLGAVTWFFLIATFGIFLNSAGSIELDIIAVTTVLVAAAVGISIPIFPGGLGTVEASIVFVLMKYGYDLEGAVALAIGLRLTNLTLVLPYSLIIAQLNGTGLLKLVKDVKNLPSTTKNVT